ncbi:MAG: ABC-type transport auxiliary lipoprotein family protein [Burkholderiales bacterium]
MARALRAIVIAAGLLLASCAFERPTSDVPASYDFGPPPAHARSNPDIPATLLVTPVRAPAWLDENANGIVYRLLYEDASQPRVYAMSRWSAAPASLLTDRAYGRFAAAARGVVAPGYSVRSDYALRIELVDFSQHFTAPGESRAVVKARASLVSSAGRRLTAQREFDIVRPAAPNAQGAVKALTEAADTLVEELVKWTAENARVERSGTREDAKP